MRGGRHCAICYRERENRNDLMRCPLQQGAQDNMDETDNKVKFIINSCRSADADDDFLLFLRHDGYTKNKPTQERF